MTAKALMVPEGITSTTAERGESGLNALIYGVSKAGKTSLACSIVNHPTVVKALHIDIDGSKNSLVSHPRLDHADIPSGYQGWDKVQELCNYLYGGQHEYNAIIVDTLTTLGSYGLDSVLHENFLRTKRDEKNRMAFPSMGDYGINNRRCVRMVRFLREFAISRGWHVVFTCHEKEYKADSGAVVCKPSLSGQAGEVIPGIPDMVGRLVQPKAGERQLVLASSKNTVADYRHPPNVKRTIPNMIPIKDQSDSNNAGMDLADIWSAICSERNAS